MNPLQLLRAIREAGIRISLEGGQVILRPAARVTPEIAAHTVYHKDHLAWLLRRRLPDNPQHEVWVTPQVWEQWLWRIGAIQGSARARHEEAA
jgi:hypothetical protein